MRFFNTEGPVERERHYLVPPLDRVDLEEILTLIRRRKYFVLHAPRQTGKTTTLLALRDLLNSAGPDEPCCVYASLETGRTVGDDVGRAMRAILGELAAQARRTLGDNALENSWPQTLASVGPDRALAEALACWAEARPRPLVLLLDEVDTLTGDALLAFLSQLRSGYVERPRRFPQSVALCGLRDIRDYRAPEQRAVRSTSRRSHCDSVISARRRRGSCSASTPKRRGRGSSRESWRPCGNTLGGNPGW